MVVSGVLAYLIQQSNLECGIVVQEDAQRAGWRGAVQGDLAHAQVGAYGVHCCGRRCLHMHHPSLCFPSAAACLDTRLNIERVLMSAMTLTCQIDGLTLRVCRGLQLAEAGQAEYSCELYLAESSHANCRTPRMSTVTHVM